MFKKVWQVFSFRSMTQIHQGVIATTLIVKGIIDSVSFVPEISNVCSSIQ